MTSTGFELTIPASGLPQTHAVDRSATGIGSSGLCVGIFALFAVLHQMHTL